MGFGKGDGNVEGGGGGGILRHARLGTCGHQGLDHAVGSVRHSVASNGARNSAFEGGPRAQPRTSAPQTLRPPSLLLSPGTSDPTGPLGTRRRPGERRGVAVIPAAIAINRITRERP